MSEGSPRDFFDGLGGENTYRTSSKYSEDPI